MNPKKFPLLLAGVALLCLPVQGQLVKAIRPVKVATGMLQGMPGEDPAITVYKGVPYAAPPVGKLRWAEPQPALAWNGVRKADAFGAPCMQVAGNARQPWTSEFIEYAKPREDCLFLNVWTPAKSAGKKLPVYVFIHGGAFREGAGSIPAYKGEGLAKKGIVTVTINYRLGILGWFNHPELSQESAHRASGNYALLDQIAALRWVHENIAALGGDPNRVTISGQSAGASSVFYLLATPLAKGLFQRAISESLTGYVFAESSNRSQAEAEQEGVNFAAAAGVKSLDELRAMSWEQLAAVKPPQSATPDPRAAWRFGMTVDGYSMPETIGAIFAAGKQNQVSFMGGNAAGDNGMTVHPKITVDEYRARAQKQFGNLSEEFLKVYPAENDEQASESLLASMQDQYRVALNLYTRSDAYTASAPRFTYFWTHVTPGPVSATWGAFHTSDLPYQMNALKGLDRPYTSLDYQVAERMSSYWANFIATGNPNGAGLPHWPSVAEQPGSTMELGDEAHPRAVASSPERYAFQVKFLSAKTILKP